MCVIAIKYIKDIGWVGAKNRDRSYKPEIHIKQSFRNNVERCLLWDAGENGTKWTEGINEFGVGVLNTTFRVVKDEKEGGKAKEKTSSSFYSPGGKTIRTSLFEKSPKNVLNKLIELEMEGFTVVFSKDEAYLLEAPIYVDEPADKKYEYKYVKLDKTKSYVRTNHGVLFPEAGYPLESDDTTLMLSRKSSESRYEIVHKWMNNVKEPMDLLRALSQKPEKDPQMNPLRASKTHGKHIMVTTGQLLIIPSENTLHYRPIWCNMQFDYERLNKETTKTWFEIISSRQLLTIKESIGTFRNFFFE